MASIFVAEATSFQSTGGQRVAEFAETLTLIFTLVCYVQNHAAFCLVTFFFEEDMVELIWKRLHG